MLEFMPALTNETVLEIVKLLLKIDWTVPFRLFFSLIFLWKATLTAKSVAENKRAEWDNKNIALLATYAVLGLGLLNGFFGLTVFMIMAGFSYTMMWWEKNRPIAGQRYDFRGIGTVEVTGTRWVKASEIFSYQVVDFKSVPQINQRDVEPIDPWTLNSWAFILQTSLL